MVHVARTALARDGVRYRPRGLAATAGPGSAVLRSIAGPAVRRIAPVTKLARVTSPAAESATQATGRGAAAASESFRDRRGRRG